ncbi:hypothetical protein [Sporisorium scitamineum]|uniref:Uncharacterized protein n=1 Tax=Sporisorium scitamineum TaxID=49012 RepID=A0A0F7RSS6_9BASI|nr:hypothetical protein [Sporisorium scitamineum]
MSTRRKDQPGSGPQADASDYSSSSVSIPIEEIVQSRRILQSSYRKFFFCHVLALVPSLVILIAALLGSLQTRQLCHLEDANQVNASDGHLHSTHSEYHKGQCRSILDGQLLASTLALGLVGWLASYTSRKDTVIVTVAIAMQVLIAESLRVLSFYWACCILVTALYLYPIQERYSHRPDVLLQVSSNSVPDWAWRLSFRDPRFFVAAWSSIAWALAEFGFGAFQILHQVALYRPADVGDDTSGFLVDGDALQQGRATAGQSGFSLLSGHPGVSTEQVPTPERSSGKARRMSASRAFEQARQRLELEEEVERFLIAKERSEVEAVLGVPLPEIPVALCALWRVDAMLWSIGSSLLLSASFTHAQGALGRLSHDRFDLSRHFHLLPPFDGYGITFVVLVVLHTIVSSLWATSLPYLGFATTTYASLLFGLAIMVASLARWGLLI